MQSDMELTKQWFIDIIDEFRSRFRTHKNLEKRIFATNFFEPCQITILWLKSKKNVDFQLIVKSHNLEIEDKRITFYGIYSLDNEDDVLELEKLLDDKLFSAITESKKGERYRKSVEFRIRKCYEEFKEIDESNFVSSSALTAPDYLIICKGKCHEVDKDGVLDDIRHELDLEFPTFKQFSRMDCIAGFIKPPIWIGNIPEQQFKDKLKGQRMIEFMGEQIFFEYKKYKGIVSQDGYIGITLSNGDVEPFSQESIDRIFIAQSFLDEIFGLLLLQNLPIYSLNDFSYTTFVPELNRLTETHRDFEYSGKQFSKRYEYLNFEEFVKTRNIISTQNFLGSIQLTDLLSCDDNKEVVMLFLFLRTAVQSFTSYNNRRYFESFILSWAIIEIYIDYLWEKAILNRRNITGKRKKRLKGDKTYSSVSVRLEILELSNTISDDVRKKFDHLREIRNKAIHELKPVDHKDANKASIISRNITRTLLKLTTELSNNSTILSLYKKYFEKT